MLSDQNLSVPPEGRLNLWLPVERSPRQSDCSLQYAHLPTCYLCCVSTHIKYNINPLLLNPDLFFENTVAPDQLASDKTI